MFKTNLKEFLRSTTIHGLSNFGSDETKIVPKITWGLFVLFSACFALYTLNDLGQTWVNDPIETSINIAEIESVPFPKVTICPKGITRHSLTEFVFNLVEINDNIREIVAPIMARLLRLGPIVMPLEEKSALLKTEAFLCQEFCSWPNEEDLEKSTLRYFESCAKKSLEERIFCRATNLIYLELNQWNKTSPKFIAFFNANSSLEISDQEWDETLNFTKCHEEAIRRQWLKDELNPIPTWHQIINVCSEKLPISVKNQINSGTIENIKDHSEGKVHSEGTLIWRSFLEETYFIEINRKLFMKPPKFENLGSFLQLLRTMWYFDASYYTIEEKLLGLDNEIDLSLFDKLEKDILVELFDIDLFETFEDFVLAFATLPALKVTKHPTKLGNVYLPLENTSKLNLQIPEELRMNLSSFLSLSLIRPYEEIQFEDPRVEMVSRALKKLNLKVKSNFTMRNKNPMMPFCEWRSEPIGAEIGYHICDRFKISPNDNGYCYSFNPETAEDMNAKLGLLNGFTFALDMNMIRPGRFNLFAPGGTYPIKRDDDMKKFQVFLSNEDSLPLTRTGPQTMSVSGSTVKSADAMRQESSILVYKVAVTANKIEANQDIRYFPQQKRGCKFEDDIKHLEIVEVYSKENCFIECKIKIVEDECGCIPWNYPSFKDSELCTPLGNICFEDTMKNVSSKLTYNDCNCLPGCNRIQYDYELAGIEELPIGYGEGKNEFLFIEDQTDEFIDIFEGKLSAYLKDEQNELWDPLVTFFKFDSSREAGLYNTLTHVKKRIVTDLALVQVYFKSPTVLHIEKKSKLTLSGILGNVGGTLGLFLGVSIISIGEVIGFIINLIMKSWRNIL